MKTIQLLVTLWLAGFTLVACKETQPINPNAELPPIETADTTGLVTPVGTPLGNAISKTIGAGGGSISNATGDISIQIPAGALTSNQQISIQPITNTNASGTGTAYRLEPHGIQFAKPVTLTMKYTQEDLKNTFVEALGIAYQDKKNVWKAVGGIKRDTAAKSITVNIAHFSDWSFFEAIQVVATSNVISPGETAKLAVHYVLPGNDGDLLAPLTQEGRETALLDPKKLLNQNYILGWEEVSSGKLAHAFNTAEYQAPGEIPRKNPVELITKIKLAKGALGLIITPMYVAPPGVSVQVNADDWVTLPGAMVDVGGSYLIEALAGPRSVNVRWGGGLFGTFKWTVDGNTCIYMRGDQDVFYHVYGSAPTPSTGALVIEPATDPGGQKGIVGTFDIKLSGHLDLRVPSDPKYTTEYMHGVIRVKQM